MYSGRISNFIRQQAYLMLSPVKQCTILIVDDGPAKLKLMGRTLGREGYNNITLAHFEKWDGGGYPQGSVAEAIP